MIGRNFATEFEKRRKQHNMFVKLFNGFFAFCFIMVLVGFAIMGYFLINYGGDFLQATLNIMNGFAHYLNTR